MIILRILNGFVVKTVDIVHDYIQIRFSNNSTLSIFNNYRYDGENISNIVTKKVESVTEFEDLIAIEFDDGKALSISLRDDDYNGPEAMVFKPKGELPIVWS